MQVQEFSQSVEHDFLKKFILEKAGWIDIGL